MLIQGSVISLAASWKPCGFNSAAEYYFDTESVRYITPNNEQFIEVWVNMVHKKPQADGTKEYRVKLWLKLDRKAYAEREIYKYDAYGHLLSSTTQNGYWISCIPGTSGERFYDVIKYYCETNL